VLAPVILYVLALLVRAALVAAYPDPGYTDAYYYVDAARSIAQGNGFNVDVLWIFPEVGGVIPADPTLPIPAFGHWMPLAALVQVPFLAVFGPQPWASAAPFVLIGATAAPLTWAIARDAGASSFVAAAAGVLATVPALAIAFMVQPDNFALFQPLVAGALWMTARGLKGSGRSFVLAGLLAGLATLSRTDGILVLGVVVLAFLWDRTRGRHVLTWTSFAGAVGVFLLVMAPWWIRQLAVFGTLSPSMASGKVLFIRSIGEWDSIAIPASLEHLLGMGAGPLLASRLGGLIAALTIYVVLITGIVLAPFVVVGGWVSRRSIDFGPFFAYVALLFGFSALLSAVHVPGGTFIHSAVALAPHSYVLAMLGIAAAVAWFGRRRTGWDPQPAARLATVALVGVVMIGALTSVSVLHAGWGAGRDQLLAVRDALDAAGAPESARVMSIDSAATRYWTGRGGVVLVNDPLETIAEVAAAYDVDWLVLDRGAVATTTPVLDGDRPAWVGEPILEDGDPVEIAVYPITRDLAE
jgi:4-amino-4-deoxy-L-arabinose transferase-like glycosyltransferase